MIFVVRFKFGVSIVYCLIFMMILLMIWFRVLWCGIRVRRIFSKEGDIFVFMMRRVCDIIDKVFC